MPTIETIRMWIGRAYTRAGLWYATDGRVGTDDVRESLREMDALWNAPDKYGFTHASAVGHEVRRCGQTLRDIVNSQRA